MYDDICDLETQPLDPEVQKLLGGDDVAFVITLTSSAGAVLYIPPDTEESNFPPEGGATIEYLKIASLACYCKNGRKICCVGNVCKDKGPC